MDQTQRKDRAVRKIGASRSVKKGGAISDLSKSDPICGERNEKFALSLPDNDVCLLHTIKALTPKQPVIV